MAAIVRRCEVGGGARAQAELRGRIQNRPLAAARTHWVSSQIYIVLLLSDISGWSLSLGAPPADRAAGAACWPPAPTRFSKCAPGRGAVVRSAAALARKLRGRSQNRPLATARTLYYSQRRAFSLTFRAGLYPLARRRQIEPLAPPAGRRRRLAGRSSRWRRLLARLTWFVSLTRARGARRRQIEPPAGRRRRFPFSKFRCSGRRRWQRSGGDVRSAAAVERKPSYGVASKTARSQQHGHTGAGQRRSLSGAGSLKQHRHRSGGLKLSNVRLRRGRTGTSRVMMV